jgi:hypothetical protein
MSVFWDEGRTDLENFCRDTRLPNLTNATAFNYIIQPTPDQMLRVSVGLAFRRAVLKYIYNILRGKDLETGGFDIERRESQFEKLKKAQEKVLNLTNWHEYLKCIKQAGYLKGDMLSAKTNIIYVYIMFLIGRVDFQIELSELRKIISKWFFMTALTGRYSSSPESQMEQDLSLLRNVTNKQDFINALDQQIHNQFTNDYWSITLPNNGLATSSPTSPAMYAYYASLNILNAVGLFSTMKVSDLLQEGLRAKKSPLEIHHLFPKEYLKKNGIKDQQQINQIANYALVEWSDNIEISDKAPFEYLPKYVERYSNNEELSQLYCWHALPENWYNMEYSEFLQKRRILIAKVIKEAFGKISN